MLIIRWTGIVISYSPACANENAHRHQISICDAFAFVMHLHAINNQVRVNTGDCLRNDFAQEQGT